MINNEVTRHIKTHTERSSEDQAAVHFLENHLKSDGRINLDFAAVDKWPNTDGRFEFVSNPDISRRPEQDFVVQIKGTHYYEERDGKMVYQFVDECSVIDNRTMEKIVNKIKENSLLILAGDIHQIEAIEFGNWFYYAKNMIVTKGANVELSNTWRTDDPKLIGLWNEVREHKPLITERMAIDGPFSEKIGADLLKEDEYKDHVVLCLNYDGKFGLNNMNNYFQCANNKGEPVVWDEWTYKKGDPVLFNDSKRFPILYNNLKGWIAETELIRRRV